MSRDDLKSEYFKADAWLALAKKIEPNRLQLRQERIERRAVTANNRVAQTIQKLDDLTEHIGATLFVGLCGMGLSSFWAVRAGQKMAAARIKYLRSQA